jgi:hypothetical protein
VILNMGNPFVVSYSEQKNQACAPCPERGALRNKIGLDVALEALREGWRARRLQWTKFNAALGFVA